MELRDVVGWLLLAVALFSVVAGVWAARHFAHHRVYARQLRLERRARREANVSRAHDGDSLAHAPRQPVADDPPPTIRPGDGILPLADPALQPDPTLTRFAGVFSASAGRDRCSVVEAERFQIQADRRPRVSCDVVQAIWVDALESDALQFAPIARGPAQSSSRSL